MKKVFLFSLILVCMFGYSQKKLSIYNYTSFAMKIYSIRTKPTTGTYPYCSGYSVGLYPGESCILENSSNIAKFPFYSPVTTPTVISSLNWNRYTTATPVNYTGLNLWNTLTANSQSFNYITYSVGSITGAGQNSGNFGVSTPGGTYTNVAGGWQVSYYRDYPNPANLNNYEDIIVFF
jgi:hypothetical protein